MSSKSKAWARGQKQVSLGEAMGIIEGSQDAPQVFVPPSGTATEAEVAEALGQAYNAKAYLNLLAKPVDELFAEMLDIELRKDSKGRRLALQHEDLQDRKVPHDASVTVPQRNGDPVVRYLSSTLRHNRALGVAVSAGRSLTNKRTSDPKVKDQAALLGIGLSNAKATPEERKQVFADFYSAFTIRVELKAAKAFIDAKEPKPQSRSKALRATLGGEAVARVDDLLAKLANERQARG